MDEQIQAEISREMTRLYKELFGRGPTKVDVDFFGPDAIVCTLEQSFTVPERALVELGEHQRLRDTRQCFQHATEEQFRTSIERVVGRKVKAFVSGIDTYADISSEVFYLEPAG
jgi:uncharacterized protein YbcI